MSDKARTSLLSLAIIVVLVFSAVSPQTAHADEGPPPEEKVTEVTSNPEEASTEESSEAEGTSEKTVEAQATDDAADAQSTEETAEAESTGEVAEANSTEEAAPAEEEAAAEKDTALLAEVPENTTVTVLDENGEAEPLATQEAANAIATSDPIWCPAGTADPLPGENGCTPFFESFDGLLNFLSENDTYQGEGTIYVQQGAYQGNDPGNVIDFNSPSYDLSNINNSNLTVTGGWNPSTGDVDAANPTVFTDFSIIIGSSANPWGGSLFISNITLQASSFPDFNESVNGITLHSDEDITVANVSVTAASGIGAELHAGDDSDDNVNIQNSNFQQNVRGGAVITAGGNVNIANSSFGNPLPDADRWQQFGLDVESGGSTSLFGVLANMNREAGATIDSGGPVIIGSSVFSGTKEMWDENGQTVFRGYGLQIVTPDTVALDDVTANDNFLWGANIDAGDNISISNSVFNANTTEDPGFIDDTGLFITGGADVNLRNVEASDNRLYGAQIDAAGSVSIIEGTFDNNRGEVLDAGGATVYHGQGLQITSLADINIRDTTADNNMLFGGELNATGDVNIADSSFSSTSTGDAAAAVGKGLEIVSGGNTSLDNVTLDGNQTVGADIQAGGDVFLTEVIATDNGTDGVAVQANCTHVFGGTYAGNGQYGLHLVNSALDVMSPPVFSGNGAGDIFPASPTLCGGAPLSSGVEGTASLTSFLGGASGFGNVSLNSFLANSRMGTSSQGLFIGKYDYVHTLTGLQIIALDSSSQQVAMAGS